MRTNRLTNSDHSSIAVFWKNAAVKTPISSFFLVAYCREKPYTAFEKEDITVCFSLNVDRHNQICHLGLI